MAHSQCTRVGNGSATEFSIDFDLGYLLEKEVTAIVDGENTERDILFISTNMVRVYGTPVPNGVNIIFSRVTPKDTFYVNFDDGDVITEKNLDTAFKQNMYATHEALDKIAALKLLVNRAVVVPNGEYGVTIPSVAMRALTALGFDINGNPTPLPLNPILIGVPGPNTVGPSQLQDNSVGAGNIIPGSIQPIHHQAGTVMLTFASRALMQAYTPISQVVATMYGEGGRSGQFVWYTGDFSALVTKDTAQGVYVPANSNPTGSTGCWVRMRTYRFYNLEWFGVSTAVADNYANVTACIALVKQEGGGTIYACNYYQIATEIVTDGNDIMWQGASQSCGFWRGTAGRVMKVTGSRHAINDFILVANTWTVATTDFVLWVENAVGLSCERVYTSGGYKSLAITGGVCADNTFTKCSFTYAMGDGAIYLGDSTNGVNGAHHFYRCRFNQGYPVNSPNNVDTFRGVRANSTNYKIGDIVSIGNYYYQCVNGGVGTLSGASVPSTVGFWYGQGITDGTTGWLLVGHTNYCGMDVDTNVYYSVVSECDFTGPYQQCMRFRNSFAGDPPNDWLIHRCTFHGPITIGAWITAGQNIIFNILDCWDALDEDATATYGILNQGGSDVRVLGCGIYKFHVGVQMDVSNWQILGGCIAGHSVASIRTGAGVNSYSISAVTCGIAPRWGSSALPIVIGTTNTYANVTNNVCVGAAGALQNNSPGGVGMTVTGNN